MGLMKAERETILRWDEEERMVSLYSASPAVWRKAARLGLKPVKETTLEGEPSGKFYTFPLSELSWRRLGPKTSRTPAQIAADAAAAARFRRRAGPPRPILRSSRPGPDLEISDDLPAPRTQ